MNYNLFEHSKEPVTINVQQRRKRSVIKLVFVSVLFVIFLSCFVSNKVEASVAPPTDVPPSAFPQATKTPDSFLSAGEFVINHWNGSVSMYQYSAKIFSVLDNVYEMTITGNIGNGSYLNVLVTSWSGSFSAYCYDQHDRLLDIVSADAHQDPVYGQSYSSVVAYREMAVEIPACYKIVIVPNNNTVLRGYSYSSGSYHQQTGRGLVYIEGVYYNYDFHPTSEFNGFWIIELLASVISCIIVFVMTTIILPARRGGFK